MNKIIVFQTDFGLDDGAISAMEGVSYRVSYDLNIRHLTHNIPQYNIFDASYRLFQAISYWPEGTTFVSVVDPGVGSDRKSVVAKTITDRASLRRFDSLCYDIDCSTNRRGGDLTRTHTSLRLNHGSRIRQTSPIRPVYNTVFGVIDRNTIDHYSNVTVVKTSHINL